MKLSKRQIGDLLTMIEHSRADIHYGEGGSFNREKKPRERDGDGDFTFDKEGAKKAERAIEFIKHIILTRD